jgi:hypothetical protein
MGMMGRMEALGFFTGCKDGDDGKDGGSWFFLQDARMGMMGRMVILAFLKCFAYELLFFDVLRSPKQTLLTREDQGRLFESSKGKMHR